MKQTFAFNPEHDLALANGDRHYIAPQNIRAMASDLAPLLGIMGDGPLTVWGWDSAIVEQLRQAGVKSDSLPSDAALSALSRKSERKTAHHLLRDIRAISPDLFCGESVILHTTDSIGDYTSQHGHILLKAPLSGSGKGLRHVNGLPMSASLLSWADALIRRHGYLTAEPYYDKVQDFAMEFRVDASGCHFIGYSLFVTDTHGRYIGSKLMSDNEIEDILAAHVQRKALHAISHYIIDHYTDIVPREWDTVHFPLYFGIDMMIVDTSKQPTADGQQPIHPDDNSKLTTHNSKLKTHPCVEINLRMNMGIIAHELYRHRIAPGSTGLFRLTFFPDAESLQAFCKEQAALHPARYADTRLIKGYLPLTPIGKDTRHHAYIICDEPDTEISATTAEESLNGLG